MSRSSALLFSFAAHLLFLFAYVAFAPRSAISFAVGDLAPVRRPVLERIRFVDMTPAAAERLEAAPSPIKRATLSLPKLPKLQAPVIAPISVGGTAVVPEIDLSNTVNGIDSALVPTKRVSELVPALVPVRSATGSGGGRREGPYTKDDVDKVVVPFPNNPKPRYPGAMQRQGIEASFVAQFVVDSTGRVDEKTLVFPPNARSQFTDEVRRTLRRSRYYPAEVGGQRVMQLVEQRFTFILLDGRREGR